MGEGDFWNDQKRAQKAISDLKVIRAMLDPLEELVKGHEDATVGLELAREANDREMLIEVDTSLHALMARMLVGASRSSTLLLCDSSRRRRN